MWARATAWTIERTGWGWPTLLGIMTLTITMALLTIPSGATAQATPVGSGETVLTGDGVEFFIDPSSNARRQAEEWRATRPDDAAAMLAIADRSQADWSAAGCRTSGLASVRA